MDVTATPWAGVPGARLPAGARIGVCWAYAGCVIDTASSMLATLPAAVSIHVCMASAPDAAMGRIPNMLT